MPPVVSGRRQRQPREKKPAHITKTGCDLGAACSPTAKTTLTPKLQNAYTHYKNRLQLRSRRCGSPGKDNANPKKKTQAAHTTETGCDSGPACKQNTKASPTRKKSLHKEKKTGCDSGPACGHTAKNNSNPQAIVNI